MAVINNVDLLLSQVHQRFIRDNGEVHRYAYKPRFEQNKDLNGVCIDLKKLCTNQNNITPKWKNFAVYEVSAEKIREMQYECEHNNPDSNPHGLIVGDMKTLFDDDEALEHFSLNSFLVSPVWR